MVIDIKYFQEKLDSTIDKFSVLDEMFALQSELQKSRKLTYEDALGMCIFLKQNTNEHFSYVNNIADYEKNASEQKLSNALNNFSSTLPFEQRCDYIGILLEKSKKSFDDELKKILKENPDVVEYIKINAIIEKEKPIIDYPLCICAETCDVYGVDYKEGSEYGYNLHYEPKLNYIEYQLFQNNIMVGLIDDLTFIKNFIHE